MGTCLKKAFKIGSLKYVAMFLIPMIFVLLYNQGLDNDSWGVLAEGRQIVENGITYFLNFFSILVKYVTIILQAHVSCRKEEST